MKARTFMESRGTSKFLPRDSNLELLSLGGLGWAPLDVNTNVLSGDVKELKIGAEVRNCNFLSLGCHLYHCRVRVRADVPGAHGIRRCSYPVIQQRR
jgi:hypothetical protein